MRRCWALGRQRAAYQRLAWVTPKRMRLKAQHPSTPRPCCRSQAALAAHWRCPPMLPRPLRQTKRKALQKEAALTTAAVGLVGSLRTPTLSPGSPRRARPPWPRASPQRWRAS